MELPYRVEFPHAPAGCRDRYYSHMSIIKFDLTQLLMGVRIATLFTLGGWERVVYLYMSVHWISITF